MKKAEGRLPTTPDDEWYTPRDTADRLAAWLRTVLNPVTPLLCPADLLPPDDRESEIPKALRAAGFTRVRVTRNLPVDDPLTDDWEPGEVVVTNPPFSLLVPFRRWAKRTGSRFCVLTRPGTMRRVWTAPIGTRLGPDRFVADDGREVAAAWVQNIIDTSSEPPEERVLGDCARCARRACPVNEMTGDWTPGRPRKLYGWGIAARYGFPGWYCIAYTRDGKRAFQRYFPPLAPPSQRAG